jgi:hypothetical protein
VYGVLRLVCGVALYLFRSVSHCCAWVSLQCWHVARMSGVSMPDVQLLLLHQIFFCKKEEPLGISHACHCQLYMCPATPGPGTGSHPTHVGNLSDTWKCCATPSWGGTTRASLRDTLHKRSQRQSLQLLPITLQDTLCIVLCTSVHSDSHYSSCRSHKEA